MAEAGDIMRQEALRRSHEMFGGHGIYPDTPDMPPLAQTPHEPPPPARKADAHGGDGVTRLLNELLGGGIDRDSLLVAALLLLLIREGGDLRLILALGYVLL